MAHKILITGGCGFIGGAFVRQQTAAGRRVVVIDRLTYAADRRRIPGDVPFYRVDIADSKSLAAVFRKEKPDAVVHFAAETHVDRSLENLTPFIRSNIEGTQNLIEAARGGGLKKFVYVSTDEVYGESRTGKFKESAPVRACNPYSATKAAGEFLIKAAEKAYDFPAVIVRPANTYGPHQFPEKLIPVAIISVSRGQKIPVYGRGLQKREWLFVDDCAQAIDVVLQKGRLHETYNIGSGTECTNIQLVRNILKLMNRSERLIRFVKDRPGHDFRYAVDFSKIKRLGWKPKVGLNEGLNRTIAFYQSETL